MNIKQFLARLGKQDSEGGRSPQDEPHVDNSACDLRPEDETEFELATFGAG